MVIKNEDMGGDVQNNFFGNITTWISDTGKKIGDWSRKQLNSKASEEAAAFVLENKKTIAVVAVTGAAALAVGPTISDAARNVKGNARSLKHKIKIMFRRH